MPQLIRPGDVQVVTKDGECLVNIQLELVIKLEGGIATVAGVQSQAIQSPKSEDKVEWQIPDFGGGPKLKFGKEG